jgi:hypothetical protein
MFKYRLAQINGRVIVCSMNSLKDYFSGRMEGGVAFTSSKPFVVMNWPDKWQCKMFDSEDEARRFIDTTKTTDPSIASAPLYAFKDGGWQRL